MSPYSSLIIEARFTCSLIVTSVSHYEMANIGEGSLECVYSLVILNKCGM